MSDGDGERTQAAWRPRICASPSWCRALHGRSDTDSDTVVAELAEHAAVEIPGAQYAGITRHPQRQGHRDPRRDASCIRCCWTRSSSGTSEGPCLTAAWDEKTIHVADLETDDRFPLYRQDALAETPIRSIMAFQLFIAGETMGALNVYAEEPNAFGRRVEEHRPDLRRALVGGVEFGAPRRAVQARTWPAATSSARPRA